MEKITRRELLIGSGAIVAGSALAVGGCGGGANGSAALQTEISTTSPPPALLVQLHENQPPLIISKSTGKVIAANDISVHYSSPPKVGDDPGLKMEFAIAPPEAGGRVQGKFGQQFPGFYLYTGRVDMHPLSPCVNSNVIHTHVIVKRYSWTSDNYAWSKLHLGTFIHDGQKCFVAYDSQHPQVCFRTCVPTRPQLAILLQDAMRAAFAAAGIGVAAWVIAAAADVLSYALIGLLLTIA